MSSRPRTLVSNSVGSILASGMLIFSTVLVPAVLARALTRAEFDAYSVVLASLPLLLIVPQSVRTVGATQLALAIARYGESDATRGYGRFVLSIAAAHVLLSMLGVELYVAASQMSSAPFQLRLGLYGILAYTIGLMAAGLVATPAAARRNFIADNVAKLWPGLFQLVGVSAIWLAGAEHPLFWIFAVYAASSWTVAALLSAFGRGISFPQTASKHVQTGLQYELFHGLRGVLWWNLTAYFATTAAVMVVAIGFPEHIVPFSIATSLLGLVSAALVAVSGPIAVHAAAAQTQPAEQRRRLFLVINSLFQGYIVAMALAIVLAPVTLYGLWLTPEIAGDVKWFTLLLMPATVARLLTMNFTIFVMSAGRQQSLWLSPLVEAVLSFLGSLLLAWPLGVIGIPMALGISAAFRLLLTILHDEPLTRNELALAPGDVLFSAGRLVKARRC